MPRRPWTFAVLDVGLALAAVASAEGAPAPPPPLERLERVIATGERHVYPFRAETGQLVRLRVEPFEAATRVRVVAPGGVTLARVEGPLVGLSQRLSVRCERSGTYSVEVSATRRGRYRITLTMPEARPADEAQLVAEAQWQAATRAAAGPDAAALERAAAGFRAAANAFHASGDATGEAEALLLLGAKHDELGRRREALEALEPARALFRAVGDRSGEAAVVAEIGSIRDDMGDKIAALALYEEALAAFRALREPDAEAQTLNLVGCVYHDFGESQQALDAYRGALALAEARGDREGQASVANNLGLLYSRLGDTPKAVSHLQRAAREFSALGNGRSQATTLVNIGRLLRRGGRAREALATEVQALALARRHGSKALEAMALNETGLARAALGDRDAARRDLHASLDLRRSLEDVAGQGLVLRNLARLAPAAEALPALTAALHLSRRAHDPAGEAETHLALARLARQQRDWRDAEENIEAALAIVESLRLKVAVPELRSTYLAATRDYYELQIDLLMDREQSEPGAGHAAAALRVSERARARSLLELLTEAQLDLADAVDPALLEEERRVRRLVNARARRYQEAALGASQKAAARSDEIDALLQQLQNIQARIRQASPRYAALTEPPILGLSEIQADLLPENGLLLEYALGDERSYLWAVTRSALHAYVLPGRGVLEAQVRELHRCLAARAARPAVEGAVARRLRLERADASLERTARQLSRTLLGPVAPLLSDKRLLFVPDGALHYLPFAMLPDPRTLTAGGPVEPLIVSHELMNAPSASIAALGRRDAGRAAAPRAPVLILSDPVFNLQDPRLREAARAEAPASPLASVRGGGLARLVYSRVEADAILAAAGPGAKALLDFDARREVVLGPEPQGYDVLHLATHATLDTRRPELSALALSLVDRAGRPQDGWLRGIDLYSLRLPVDLVVLSGCETALGQEIRGEGLVGLTRGFIHAGARRVLASLWMVDDRATAELMKEVYARLFAAPPRPPAAALREAQVALWRRARWSHPYYWGAFVLQGEWR